MLFGGPGPPKLVLFSSDSFSSFQSPGLNEWEPAGLNYHAD
jgi:hypothetical protein